MRKRSVTRILSMSLLVLALVGCASRSGQNLPPTAAPTEGAVSPVPTDTPIPLAATSSPAAPIASATSTATIAPTAEPSPVVTSMATAAVLADQAAALPASTPQDPAQGELIAVITGDAANLRGGPGTDYPIVGQASAGQRYPALGRNAAGDWWQIDAGGLEAWVSTGLASVEGDATTLAVTAPNEPPVQSAQAVQVYETTLAIPTYPYAAFTSEVVDPIYHWTYRRFDQAAYEASNPQPVAASYLAVVLENEYLKITLLPELGGRIYQVIFKPTGSNELYQNPVIKPSPWGPAEQGGWLAAGGIEWGLPVAEHGYAWAEPWGHITTPFGDAAGVTVFMPYADHLRAEVDVILRAGEAAFTIQPRIVNPAGQTASYQFWMDAMLAPGPANEPGPNLRFLLPTDQVTVHSRGDDFLPVAQQAMAWPTHDGVDYSRLGNWRDWLGVFERPAAHGPFTGVYDPDVDEGVVRVFPPAAAPGSKIFAMGYGAPINPAVYTDDGSAYVELHGGVTPTYWDQAALAAGDTYTWQETWYPVAGIGGVSYADGSGAMFLNRVGDSLAVGVFPVRAVQGRIEIAVGGQILLDEPVAVSPAQPWQRDLALDGAGPAQRVTVRLFDQSGAVVLNYTASP